MARFSVQGLLRLISQGISWAVFFLEALGKNPLPSLFWLLAWLSSCGCNDIFVSLLVVSRKPLLCPVSSPHTLPLSFSVFKASSGESPSLPPLNPADASNLLHQAFLWAQEIAHLQRIIFPLLRSADLGPDLHLWDPFTGAPRLVFDWTSARTHEYIPSQNSAGHSNTCYLKCIVPALFGELAWVKAA